MSKSKSKNSNNNNSSTNNSNNNINSTCGFDFMLYTLLIAFTLSKNLDSAEQDLLGLFFQQIGGNLLSLSLYTSSIEDLCENSKSSTTANSTPTSPKVETIVKPF